MSSERIGVGLVTYRRPSYYEQVAKALLEHVEPVVSWIGAVHDGPDPGDYQRDLLPLRFLPHRGVAEAKNALLRSMLDDGCQWLFLCEDDMIVDSPDAVLGYIAACKASGWQHLGGHMHGENDLIEPGFYVSYWWVMPGAWCVYSRRSIVECGMFDPVFHNCHEHLEHTLRLAQAGFTSGWRHFGDATGSEAWLHEIPGSRDTSLIRSDPAWMANIAEARLHWIRAHPDTAKIVWG